MVCSDIIDSKTIRFVTVFVRSGSWATSIF